ncbi:SDR family NAD(P)-dependent oxidoreductase [Shimia ponticola]|uniref:SDR family NAD(P)-dependent oxidoreductase n=1 Tax=Shimia ponticola TaxID=2582893 RepID=UPI00164AF1B1|nr:SDR family oxidoreductase [Shimia ponticola]
MQGLFDLAGRVILVTGATGGIGSEVALALAAHGARVVLHGRDAARLEALAARVPGSVPVQFDVTDHAAVASSVDTLIARFGRIDGLFCIAAARDRRPLAELDTDSYARLVAANLIAPYHLARCVAPHMQAAGWGRIVMMTSLAQDMAMPGDAGYPSTKAGLAGLVRSLAVELGKDGITVNGVSPGPIATEVNLPLGDDPKWAAMINRTIPLKRWGRPDEMSGVCVFLASEASSYMTGQILTLDGGASVRMFPMD